MEKESNKDQSTLNDYSQRRNKEGLKEVEAMLKKPLSLEEALDQTKSFMEEKNN
jgi:phage-related minor tail protein